MADTVFAATALNAMVSEKALFTGHITVWSPPSLSTGTNPSDGITFAIVFALTIILTIRTPFILRTGFK